MKLIFATRPSRLARWQTQYVVQLLQAVWADLICEEVIINTKGDRVIDRPLPEIGGKGLFTFELEQALLEGKVHAAVHSLKDLPTEDPPGLVIGAVPERADARDVLICPSGHHMEQLPENASVGTSSLRRRAQLLACQPDLMILPIRGNVDTRLRMVADGKYDAIVLAAAGVTRLGEERQITQYLSINWMMPAPGQGALAIQCRADDSEVGMLLNAIDHHATRAAVAAERAFLSALGGGCSIPVGAYAQQDGEGISLHGVVTAPDGEQEIRLQARGEKPEELGFAMAEQAFRQGARELLQLAKDLS